MNILVSMAQGAILDSFIMPETVKRLKEIGGVEFTTSSEQFTHEEMVEKIHGKDIVITGWGSPRIDAEIIANADKLKYHLHTGGTVSPYVCEEEYQKGIKVYSGNELYAESVAEGVIAYIMASLRKIPRISTELTYNKNWIYQDMSMNFCKGLLNKSVGIISYGTISKYLVQMLSVFHVDIKLYSSKNLPEELLKKYNIVQTSIEDVFSTCDIITMQTAKNPHTIDMITKKQLSLIKDGALFVNTSRGPIVNEADLISVIKENRFFVMLDVYNMEPLAQDSELFGHENVMLMPHMAGPTIDRRDFITNVLLDECLKNMQTGEKSYLEIPWELAKEMTIL